MHHHLRGASVGTPCSTREAQWSATAVSPQVLHPHAVCPSYSPSLRTSLLRPPSATSTQTVQQASPAPVYLQDSKTLGFLEAAKQLGIKNKLRPAEFAGLRGMCLPLESLDKSVEGEILVSVPRRSSITLAPKQRCPFPDWINTEYWQPAPWFVKLGLLLLHERNLGQASRLSAYVAQLPRSFDHPVLWQEKARLQQLQCQAVIRQVEEQQQEWAELHKELCEKGLQPGAQPVSKQDFFWALCAVRSRTFSGPYIGSTLTDRLRLGGLVGALALTNISLGLADTQRTLSAAVAVFLFNIIYEVVLSRSLKQYAMCPVMDLINHSSREQSEVSYDYFLDSYTVAASKPYAKGEQVFVSYGRQTNDSLLQYYGFVEADNPNDCYLMTNMLRLLKDKATLDKGRLDALEKDGLLSSLKLVSIAPTGFPASTLQALRFLIASDAEASKGLSAFESGASAEIEARLAEVLVHACSSELDSLGTTLAEDQALLQSAKSAKAMPGPDRLAVAFRIEKKKVLQSCLKALSS
ncbi:hypothetical protein DUNSADRAFT_13246 [Dunaliella salina]|uniref:SET domain-containing protein n=1 Tax=Dunaliella salina TaxID=3046 RepID=A0ABQ7H3J0_DUNSA|nr:hypothetical protein DUNSADRAFT_13246 [Dunaliella salina]|eukprot:KAF5841378.1 hypothetical protein DUNSADRAFT_13246 [Dunaliella salina]